MLIRNLHKIRGVKAKAPRPQPPTDTLPADLGFVDEPSTRTYDLGFVDEPATKVTDLGLLP